MADNMTAEMKEVISAVKSCLMTNKHATTVDKLHKDYKSLEDKSIPYRNMGFPSLDAFLQAVPGIRIMRRGAEVYVEVIPTKETAHIARLVAGQKQSKPSRKPQRFRPTPPPRRPQASLHVPRAGNSGPMRNRPAWNGGVSNNRPSNNAMSGTNNQPRPLMQSPARPPLMSLPTSPPSTPRYTGGAKAQMASPSKRMLERNIQPQQHLDYARNVGPMPGSSSSSANNSRAPSSANNSRAPSTPPVLPSRPVESQLPPTPVTPSSGVQWPTAVQTTAPAPVETTPTNIPTAVPWEPTPSLARTKLCDRLNIFNSTVTNGNNGIQVTFSNVAPLGGDCPLTPVSPPAQITLTHDPRNDLKNLVESLHLQSPIYKILPIVGKKGNGSGIYGQVLIGSRKFSSYPIEAATEEDAEIIAAREALAELTQEHGTKVSLRETTDAELIKKRVLSIVDEHNGVFAHNISTYYEERHNEKLPGNWCDEAEKWSEIEIEKGVKDMKILRRRVACVEKVQGLPSPKVDKVLLNPIGRVEPGMLTLPDERYWVVYVTLVISSVEIWVRLVGENYNDKYEVMTHDMIKHYTNTEYPVVETVEVGGYYALEDADCWHRVRVIETDVSTGEAEIFFIDFGDEDTVSVKSLRPLDKKFCLLPAQAMKVSLAGLEYFVDCASALPRIDKILRDGIFYAEDLMREVTEDGPTANVVFYDTNGPEDVNVNELISKKIIGQLITDVPRLEVEGHVTGVHISHVENNGDVFIQVKDEGMKFLAKMLNRLTQNGLEAEDQQKAALNEIDRTKVYFAKCAETGDWYRARITDDADMTRKLKVFLIDFGRTMFVEATNILQLEVLSPFLGRYPAQAMKVRLHNIEPSMFDEKMAARLVELAPPSELLVLKVVKPSYRGSSPIVELFKRIQPDDVLIAINNTLALKPELSIANGDGNNNVRPRRRVERTNSRISGDNDETKALEPPEISPIGEYFDVHVSMAANPGNFTVQPLRMAGALQKMMEQLQVACIAHAGPNLSLESVREGRLYAAKHIDNNWYRVCVSNVVNEHMVTVYFCDYGDVTVIGLDKLQRLQKQFLELPYQAIKAKLVGIQPTNMDWAVEDAIRFQKLVVERAFVSVVVESAPDRRSPGDTVLGLTLIDVSTPDDINIGKLLVDEGRATYTE